MPHIPRGISHFPELDPRVWLLLTCVASLCVLNVGSAVALAAVWAAACCLYVGLGGSLAFLGRCLSVLGVMYALIVISPALKFDGTADLALTASVGISIEGLFTGLLTCARLMAMVLFSLILTQACSSAQLSDALTSLLRPLGKLGFPSGDIAVMLGLALRCIPLSCEKLATLALAQNARGAAVGLSRNPIRKVLSYTSLMLPLCVTMFRYAEDFAFALSAKGFTGAPRCEMHVHALTARDWAVLGVGTGLLVGMAVLF